MKGMQWMALVGLVMVLQGCAVSSTNQVTKPGQAKGGFMNLSKAADITVDQPKVLQKQTGKVVVGSFKIGFLTDNNARATAHGLMGGGSAKATAHAHLKGLDPQAMQTITNELYQNFIETLKAKGYTVVTAQELGSEPAYAALQDAGTASSEEKVGVNLAPDAKAHYVAPDGMKLVYFLGEKKALLDISTETIKKAQALAEKTGANVLAVNYLVNFVNAQGHGGLASGASVKVGQGLSIAIGSALSVYPDTRSAANIKLGQAIYSDETFARIANVTSAAGKTVNTAVNLTSVILGGGTSQEESYDFNIDAEKYHAAVKDIGMKTNDKLIAKLAEGRAV